MQTSFLRPKTSIFTYIVQRPLLFVFYYYKYIFKAVCVEINKSWVTYFEMAYQKKGTLTNFVQKSNMPRTHWSFRRLGLLRLSAHDLLSHIYSHTYMYMYLKILFARKQSPLCFVRPDISPIVLLQTPQKSMSSLLLLVVVL